MKYIYRGQKGDKLGPIDRSSLVYKIIIAVLAILLIAISVYAFWGAKGFNDEKYKSTIISLVNTEMKQAKTQSENLSRSAISGTSTTLGKVRQHVHSLETLNSLNILILGQGGRLFPQQLLDTTQGLLDSYANQLLTGQPTNELLSNLMKNLEMLNDIAINLGSK